MFTHRASYVGITKKIHQRILSTQKDDGQLTTFTSGITKNSPIRAKTKKDTDPGLKNTSSATHPGQHSWERI
jgi:hypothetical protein